MYLEYFLEIYLRRIISTNVPRLALKFCRKPQVGGKICRWAGAARQLYYPQTSRVRTKRSGEARGQASPVGRSAAANRCYLMLPIYERGRKPSDKANWRMF